MDKEKLVLTKEDKINLINLARHAIEARLFGKTDRTVNYSLPIMQKQYGAFVTLFKNPGKRLRGCIGVVTTNKPLKETIRDMAISAAFRDPRFEPLKPSEYKDVLVEISILYPPYPITPDEIEVGKHGLIVSYGPYTGLLLPQVATEYNMDKYEFLSQTCVKAGLPRDIWKKEPINIQAFEAEVFSEEEIE